MPKDYFDDMPSSEPQQSTPSNAGPEKSIRNIPISVSRPSSSPTRMSYRPSPSGLPRVSSSGTGRGKMALWGVAGLAVLALLGAVGFSLLKGTVVEVFPRTHTVVFDESTQYTAYPKTEGDQPGQLMYSVVDKEFTEKMVVPASGSEKTEDYASGTITIYNNHNSQPLRLIKNTRFETPSGMVFRIRNSVVVPGKTGETAGSISTTVFADQPGVDYNIGPVEKFTLPGLKTSAPDMFPNIYARSTLAMSGGFVGERPIVAEKDLIAAQKTLKEKVTAAASAGATEGLSQEDFAFPQLMTLEFTDLAPEKSADGSVSVGQKAIAHIPVFEHSLFAKALATATSADAEEGIVGIPDKSTFSVTLAGGDVTLGKPIPFKVSGKATFVWDVDIIKLAEALAGTEKASFQNLVETFPGVESAEAFVRPMWKSTFPTDPARITITLKEQE